MTTHPNCKINLGLRVLRRRPDGYHDLATVFLPVPLCDDLTIEPLIGGASSGLGDCLFTQDGIPINCSPEQNLCVRAYRLLRADYPQLPPVAIHLHKVIPFGAGLGGGSSDAAFALKMLNEIGGLGLTSAQLCAYAARLGADCAFFVKNSPAYATGIGDQLYPLDSNPIRGYRLVLAKPNESVSTREAYMGLSLPNFSGLDAYDHPLTSPLCRALAAPADTWRQTVFNDFETTVFPSHPAIARLKQHFYNHGAVYSAMSGSGASVFALFDENAPLPTALIDTLGDTRIL